MENTAPADATLTVTMTKFFVKDSNIVIQDVLLQIRVQLSQKIYKANTVRIVPRPMDVQSNAAMILRRVLLRELLLDVREG